MTKTYKIKPLEWKARFDGYIAETPFASYRVLEYKWGFCFDEHYDEGEFECDSIRAGMAAAQKHWENRVLRALEEVKS